MAPPSAGGGAGLSAGRTCGTLMRRQISPEGAPMIRLASVVAILCFALSGPALAASAAVTAACRGDAYRLCGPVIHDEAKRHACMHEHAAQLSAACLTAVRASR
jgi:hypothetical protein